MNIQKNTGRYNARNEKLQTNRTISCLCEKYKPLSPQLGALFPEVFRQILEVVK